MSSKLVLGAPFSDHMLLQRGRPNPLWGWDLPGQRVRVELAGPSVDFEVSLVADSGGGFACELPELSAPGPYRLRVKGSSELSIEDVLAGDVWLAFGQSNMEWPVSMSAGAASEIAAADYPSIRYAFVSRTAAEQPASSVPCRWVPVSRETVDQMSAVGYFFARELHQELGVPIGILCAAWGGTRLEAWTSGEALSRVLSLSEERARYYRAPEELDQLRAEYTERLLAWERENLPQDPGNLGLERGFAKPEFADASWPSLAAPGSWQAAGKKFNGAVWFRKEIEVPQHWAGNDLQLSLGLIDDFDHTYFNGEQIGSHPQGTPGAFQIRRNYVVPSGLVRAGRNVIAVRVFDHVGEGGLLGPREELFLEHSATGTRVSLVGPWRMGVEHEIPLVPAEVFSSYPRAPEVLQPENAPSALYNGMLAPLVPFGLSGALFYQGESNVDTAGSYAERMTAMIRDLRTRFGQGQFPFYYVELAGFRGGGGWPLLREAQAKVLVEPVTFMSPTTDIGEADDIHPRNKLEVGRRLSVIALREHYGRSALVVSGPTLSRVEIRGRLCRVHFAFGDGLCTKDGAEVLGFELAEKDLVFKPARARIDAACVLVESEEVSRPAAVRYAFRDYVEVNLVNNSGLPARPFRTDFA